MNTHHHYANRREAGRALADALHRYAGEKDPLVLALPRGGVPVAFEVALALDAELDLMLVRKLGLPGHEELAMGAIASGGVRVLNRELVAHLHIGEGTLEAVARREQEELERRERSYRDDRPPPRVEGRTVILVDDGLATGSTMLAAVEALRQRGAGRVVVAVPVAPADAAAQFLGVADDFVCPTMPEEFMSVGLWYDDFAQTTDEEVHDLLGRAWARAPQAADTENEYDDGMRGC